MADETVASEVIQENGWTILALTGRLDRVTAPQIGEQAESALASCAKLALDVKELSYLSSAGIRVLLRLAQKARKEQKAFAVCGAEGFVKEVIEESNMNAIVTIYGERSELG
ncbi:MAG: STAS domain-containing protein [Selenomonadaceae bacterium]|nr:STAS domain-containing protein [Selenomonadaceae bacterium]